jgi:hypothetical protein
LRAKAVGWAIWQITSLPLLALYVFTLIPKRIRICYVSTHLFSDSNVQYLTVHFLPLTNLDNSNDIFIRQIFWWLNTVWSNCDAFEDLYSNFMKVAMIQMIGIMLHSKKHWIQDLILEILWSFCIVSTEHRLEWTATVIRFSLNSYL